MAALLSVRAATAGAEEPLALKPVASGLTHPVALTFAPDGSQRLFIVEQAGTIRLLKDGVVRPVPFLDIRAQVVSGGEMGLLSVAFHPAFASNGRCFVNYTTRQDETLKTVIAEHHVARGQPDLADPRARVVLEIVQPFANHNGGQLQFGPDGYLYIGMGDGGAAGDPYGHGQNIETLLGAILRINVDGKPPYEIPPDNPFVNRPGADEIWAYGLRNPWRFSFDRKTGRLFAGDVGQDRYEEVDLIERGGNYGWNRMEGAHCFPPTVTRCATRGLRLPITEYGRSEGISVTGGSVYRGRAIPDLVGTYLFGDFGSSKIWGLREVLPGLWGRVHLLTAPEPISSFGEDADGECYVVGYHGTLFRITKQ